MKLFSTLTKRITVLLVVLAAIFNVSAAEYTFASLAEMHAAKNLVEDDIVKITGDVVFEYSYQYYFVVSDKNGTASCMNDYCYYIGQLIIDQSLKAGDVLKNYCGKIVVSPLGGYRLEPTVKTISGLKMFGDGIVIEHKTEDYTVKTTKVTIKDLLDNPALYDGKVVSLDLATTKTVGFNTYLIQGTDTLKSFTISGLDDDSYPAELVIDRALFRITSNATASLSMSQNDFDVTFKTVKSFKATGLTENIVIDLTVQVLKKEVYEGKTYLTVFESRGDKLIDCAGLRILLNTENDEDKKIKVGDVINIKTSTAQYKKWVDTGGVYFTHSLVTLEAHETTILENKPITYYVIYIDNIFASLEDFEFLPVTIASEFTFTGKMDSKNANFAQAQAIAGEESLVKIYVDITKKPTYITDKFYLNGLLEIPLTKANSMNAYVIPFSEKDFFSNLKDFSSIAAVIKEGTPINSVIKYQINSDMTIIGIDSIAAVGEEDRSQHVIFVKDNTASLMLLGRLSDEFKVGDVIKGIIGSYSALRPSSITSAGARNFGVANSLYLDSMTIEKGQKITPVVPKKVTISQLLNNDNLASQVVTISDFTYKVVTEIVQTETIDRHYIYQDGDSIIVDESFGGLENASSINVIYYLNDFYSRLLPYEGEVTEGSDEVAIDNNFVTDNTLFVLNNIIYAEGAEIEVYDVMGRFIASGIDAVGVEGMNQNIFVVRTKYFDGQVFVTKVANR